jgi:hypothetical protein
MEDMQLTLKNSPVAVQLGVKISDGLNFSVQVYGELETTRFSSFMDLGRVS